MTPELTEDERLCPVCGGSTIYPSYRAMMDHWKMVHPNRTPTRGSNGLAGGGGMVPVYINEIVKRHIDNEDELSLGLWIANEMEHPREAREMWQVLGLHEEIK